MTCPHDGAELVAYDADVNPAKAGRSFCSACNCSFAGAEPVTRGAGCDARMLEPARLAGAVVESEPGEGEPEPAPATRRRARG